MKILLPLVFLLGACSSEVDPENEDYGKNIENIDLSCADEFEIDGFKKIEAKTLEFARRSLLVIYKSDKAKFDLVKNEYCQKIKMMPEKYCVLYLLKDGSPGGDFQTCHKR